MLHQVSKASASRLLSGLYMDVHLHNAVILLHIRSVALDIAEDDLVKEVVKGTRCDFIVRQFLFADQI